MLSRGEAERLLAIARQDELALGRRDYAFLLARLRLGVPLGHLQKLRWGHVEAIRGIDWVRWHGQGEKQRLPGEVWQAICAALEAGDRLEGMGEDEYIFAPLREPGILDAGSRREDWLGERHLSSSTLLANLKLYGRLAGIEATKGSRRPKGSRVS